MPVPDQDIRDHYERFRADDLADLSTCAQFIWWVVSKLAYPDDRAVAGPQEPPVEPLACGPPRS